MREPTLTDRVEELHEKIDNLGTIVSAIGFMVLFQFMYWVSTFIL